MKHLSLIGLSAVALAAGALGVLIGILLRYPTGWSLAADAANVIGAAFGAILTVSAAVALWYFQQRTEAARIAQSIRNYSARTSKNLGALISAVEDKQRMKALKIGAQLDDDIHQAFARFERIDQSVVRLSPKGLQGFFKVEERLLKLRKEVSEICFSLEPLGGGPPTTEQFQYWAIRLSEFRAKLESAVASIE